MTILKKIHEAQPVYKYNDLMEHQKNYKKFLKIRSVGNQKSSMLMIARDISLQQELYNKKIFENNAVKNTPSKIIKKNIHHLYNKQKNRV